MSYKIKILHLFKASSIMSLILLISFGIFQIVNSDCLYKSNLYLGDWKPSTSDKSIPNGAIQGGFATGNLVYICRIKEISGTLPSSNKNCYTVKNNTIETNTKYEVLTNGQEVWVTIKENDDIPCNALIVGTKNMYPTYISRVPNPGNSINLGYAYQGTAYIGFDNIVHEYKNFDVLTLVPKTIETDYSKYFKLQGKYLSLRVKFSTTATLYFGFAKSSIISISIEKLDQDIRYESNIIGSGSVLGETILTNATDLDLEEYIWISLEGSILDLGRDGSADAVLSLNHTVLKYITSVRFGGENEPLWKIPDLDEF